MVTIKVRQNGSLLVEGEDVKLVDWNGAEYIVPKKPFALCRCGPVEGKAVLRRLAQDLRLHRRPRPRRARRRCPSRRRFLKN